MKRLSKPLLAVAGLILFAPSCIGGGHGAGGGEFRVARVFGAVTMQVPGEAPRPLREGDAVPVGAGMTTGRGAGVRLEGGDGRAVELAADTRAGLLTPTRVGLDLGSALGETGKGDLSFDSRGVTVEVARGAARLERLLGTLRVGVYSGSAHVDMLGRGFDVPSYRQQDFAGGNPVDRDPRPLALKAEDPWDRELLGDVLELDRSLAQFVRGFNNEFSQRAAAPAFLVAFVPGRPTTEALTIAPKGLTPADKLIGLVFAQRLAVRDGSDARLSRYFAEMVAEFAQDATWGLIAKERGLDLRALLPAVLDAIRRGTAPPSSAGPSGGGGGNPTSEPTSRPTTKPKPAPTHSPSPTPSASPTPTPTCNAIDRLLGTCGRTQSSSGGSSGCSILGVLLGQDC